MESRWHSDFSVSVDEMSRLIETHTSVVVKRISFLAEGWDFKNYLVNSEWVFRYPKRYSEADTLLREKLLLESLRIPTAYPIFEFWVPQPSGLKVPLAGYRYIPGTPLAKFAKEEIYLVRMGEALGLTLAALHNHPKIGQAIRYDPLRSWMGDRGTLKTDELPVARKYLSSACYEACVQAFDEYRPRRPVELPVTTHNDLGVEHILVNDNREMCAIIDWADARVASRYVDFAGLWGWGGDEIIEQMLANYPIQPNRDDSAQIRAHGLCYALGQLLEGDRLDHSELKATAVQWVQSRFCEGSLKDIYTPFTNKNDWN